MLETKYLCAQWTDFKGDLVENLLQISKYFCSIFDFISFAKNFNNHRNEVGSIKFFQGYFADNLRMCEGRFYIHFNLASVWFTKKLTRIMTTLRCVHVFDSKFKIRDEWFFVQRKFNKYPFQMWFISKLEPRIPNNNPIIWSSNG